MVLTVCHVITRLDKGGSAENTLHTVIGLDKARYRVVLFKGSSLESQMSSLEREAVKNSLRTAEENGVEIYDLNTLVRQIKPSYDLKTIIQLFKLFKRIKPDIVHTHTSKAGILGRWAAFFAHVPIIIHTPHGHIFFGYFGRLKTRFFMWVERITTLITDRIIALTKREGKDYLNFKIAPRRKIIVIHSGIDLNNIRNPGISPKEMRNSLDIREYQKVIGMIGRLVPVKGHAYLIEAAREVVYEFPESLFLLIGDGPLRPNLEERVHRLGLERNFRFLGWRSDIPELLSVIDILVHPSLNEGMGRVLAEAMAAGKPVIASLVGGIPDLIIDRVTGLLVPPGQTRALAGAIKELLQNDRLCKRLGDNGRIRAEMFDVSDMIKEIDLLYLEISKDNLYATGYKRKGG